MFEQSLQPYVRHSMYDDIGEGWVIDRSIWDYEIIFISKGKMIVEIGGKTYTATEGDIIFLRPRIHHRLLYGGVPTSQPHVHFDFVQDEKSDKIYVSLKKYEQMTEEEKGWFRHDDLAKLGFDFPVVMRLHNRYVIQNLLFQLIDEFRLRAPDYRPYTSALLTELLLNIKRGYVSFKSDLAEKYLASLEELPRFILKNVDRSIPLEELADSVHVSKFYFIRLFKKHFGQTPQKYLERIRTERAKDLLMYPAQKSISDISETMNFDSQQSFSRWFKKNTGLTPTQYRKKQIGSLSNK